MKRAGWLICAAVCLKQVVSLNDHTEHSGTLESWMRQGHTFVESVFSFGVRKWGSFWQDRAQHGNMPWDLKQCNATGDGCRQRCSCYDVMNMAELWLQEDSLFSPEEYRQRYRRAVKLHHPDKGGSDACMRFLTGCASLLCGDETCRHPEKLAGHSLNKKEQYLSKMENIRGKCTKRADKKGANAGLECYQEEIEELNIEMLDPQRPKAMDDVRNPRQSNAFRGHEELVVFLDGSMSLKGSKHTKAKKVVELLFPRFERTPTSVHLIGGTRRSSGSSVFKERVEGNGGLYDHTHIRATLIWNNCNDVDLHVREPGGTELFYGHKKSSASHGYLDIDRNVGSNCDARPVENIRWEIGASSPMHGRYEVLVKLFSHDGRAPHHTPFELEVSVGPETQRFQGSVVTTGEEKLIHTFEYGAQRSAESKELFSNATEFTIDDIFRFWQCESWTTYMWEYIFKTLMTISQQRALAVLDVIIVTDGADNDSEGAFNGSQGFNAMMNQLHARGIRPRISVYCLGSEHCAGDADGMHFYRDLCLFSGGVFVADDTGPEDLHLGRNFAVHATGSVEEREQTERKSKKEWLLLAQSEVPVVNKHEPYTQELVSGGTGRKTSTFAPHFKCVQRGATEQCTLVEADVPTKN